MGSIYLGGSEEQKQKWLPPMARWEKIGCFGLTEPLVGSGTSRGMLTTAKRDGDTWILNGQKKWIMNALNKATINDLRAAFEDARDDSAVHGVILTGAGEKAFAAGADIAEIANNTAVEAEEATRRGQTLTDLIENLGKPVIAAVNGFALGGGCELAMACAIRIAAETAKFGQPEVKLGVMPGYGGTQRMPRLVGRGRALKLILSGDIIDAAEAYRIQRGKRNCG